LKVRTARNAEQIELRKPHEEDGLAIWSLVKESNVLDENSAYAYLMFCKFFADTCVVAKQEEQVVGFITAFHLPNAADTLFIWQIGVSEQLRGTGVGTAMIKELLQRKACRQVRFLEATVTLSNTPSESLFRKIASEMETTCEVTECFPTHFFPQSHEAEWTFRIGPMDAK
jgi:L-2,4-diaminobutyric acid acetyltransferase